MDSRAQFEKDVHDLFELQNNMKLIAAKAKEAREGIKDQLTEVEDRVKGYMTARKIPDLEYSDHVLACKEVTRGLGLSRKSLKAALVNYYDGEEEAATEVYDALLEHIGTKQVTVLARRAMKKPDPVAEKESTPAPPVVLPTTDEAPPDLDYDSE